MIKAAPQLKELLKKFGEIRKKRGIKEGDLESKLVLGPGWLRSIENGDISISMEFFFSLLSASNINLNVLTQDLRKNNTQEVPRNIYSVQAGKNLRVLFRYAKHDATYILKNATTVQFNQVVKTLRDELARLDSAKNGLEAIKTEAVAGAFKKAVTLWPNANPSDVWWFLIYRAYLDPLNHPAKYSRLSFEQSWKRTGGWALEEVLVRHYAHGLKRKGINLFIAPSGKREELLSQAKVNHRLEADKADIFLTGNINGKEIFFGVVHVKASFAERRTDDVPMSKALVDGGYVSPLWTMDCKSLPSASPCNKGELGVIKPKNGKDTRSAKRKDIEDDGFFSACFSYNKNTIPTPLSQSAKSNIYVCDFSAPNSDVFHHFICDSWAQFQEAINSNSD